MSTPAAAGDEEGVAARLEQQQKEIEQLRREVEALRKHKPVTREDVDRRIQEFETAPESRLLIAGYGTVQYEDASGSPGSFTASLNPGFHFRMTDTLHINAEPEFEFEGGGREASTKVDLEFVEMDYMPTDWLTVSAGKMLVPFNVFGPRLHPGWINRMVSKPVLYSSGEEGSGLIPMITDFGVMLSGGAALWSDSAKINYALYVTNGPNFGEEPGGEAGEGEGEAAAGTRQDGDLGDETSVPEADLLEVEFENTPDLNTEKAFGGRLGFLPVANLELGVSYMTGQAPDTDDPFHLVGADAWYAYRGLELRGEYAFLTRKAPGNDPEGWGYWVQAAFRLRHHVDPSTTLGRLAGRLEPVIRWGDINGIPGRNRDQLALGINYWLFESAPLKVDWERNTGAVDQDRVLVEFAYGF